MRNKTRDKTQKEMVLASSRFILRCFLRICLVSLVLSASWSIHANVSQSFRPSINSAGTGFVNGIWDYVTTPYLYTILDKNALSTLYVGPSNALDTEGFNLGFRIGIPIMPLYSAFSIKSFKTNNIIREFSERDPTSSASRENKINENKNLRVNAMLGTHIYNLGIGIFIKHSQNEFIDIKIDPERGVENSSNISGLTSRQELELHEQRYGVEFGSSDNKLRWAWSFSVDFRDFNQFYNNPSPTGDIFIRAPVFDFYDPDASGIGTSSSEQNNIVTRAINDHMGGQRGFARREVGLNFLGWFSDLGLFGYSDKSLYGNIGLDWQSYFIPATSGANSNTNRDVSLTGYKLRPTLFYDYDFILEIDGLKSMFRLSPAFRFTYHTESASLAANDSPVQEYITTDSFTIDITERELEFLFGMKLFYQILPKLKLFFSYIPTFTLDHLREESLSKLELIEALGENPNTSNKIQHKLFSSDLTNFNLGLSYEPSRKISINLQVDADSSDGKFDLSRIRVGLDLLFF